MDIKGQKVVDFWQVAVRAVMSTIIFRPGISQVRVYNHELSFVTDHLVCRAKFDGASAQFMTGKR